MGAGLEASTRFSTWSVAGVKEDELDDLLAQTSESYRWVVLFLQQAFRRTEGVAVGSGHMLFTSPVLTGALRCPAMLVHSRCTSGVEFVGGGERWLAVTRGGVTMVCRTRATGQWPTSASWRR